MNNANIVNVNTKCPCCNRVTVLSMTNEQYNDYRDGYKNIQVIFPDWTPEEREMLITGICGKCWKEMFQTDDEDMI